MEQKDGASSGAPSSHSFFMFHRAVDCEECLLCLHKSSGGSFGDKMDSLPKRRAPIVNDPKIREEIMEKAGENKVLVASIALPGPSSDLLAFEGGVKEPKLYVLTMKGLLEFSINMASWELPAEDADIFFDGEDFNHAGAAAAAATPNGAEQNQLALADASGTELAIPAETEADRIRGHIQRQGLEVRRRPLDSIEAETGIGIGVPKMSGSKVASHPVPEVWRSHEHSVLRRLRPRTLEKSVGFLPGSGRWRLGAQPGGPDEDWRVKGSKKGTRPCVPVAC